MLIRLAFRNLFRNSRRTLMSLIMIAGGFASVVVFQGFAAAILEDIRWGAVNSQFGHIQIASQKLWDPGSDDVFRDRQLEQPEELKKKVAALGDIKSVSARQFFYGLASTGEQSVSAQIIGFEPHLETELISKEMIIEGATFTPPAKPGQIVYEAAVGEGLARLLRAKPGQTLTIIGQTADGGINAIDAEIKFLFRTVVQEIDDTTVYVPLSLSQKVLDSDGAERVVIKLKDHDMVGEMLPKVKAILPEGTQARGWRELSRLYNQTERYFETQNAVVAGIILALILLSITSTVGMSVSERTGEIGTMRALGDTKPAILRLFAFEGLLLGGIGGVIGAILGYAISVVLTAVKVPIVLPGATQPIPVRVLQLPSAYILAFILTVFAAFLATMIAARRASQMNIVDALKKNV